MKKDKKVGLYMRVSTKDQSCEMQLSDLERYSKKRGFSIFKVYKDNGVSGTKESRPALSELMNDAKKRKFDIVLVWRFDRFARSTKHLISALYEFRNLGIDFISYQGEHRHIFTTRRGHIHDYIGYGKARTRHHSRTCQGWTQEG